MLENTVRSLYLKSPFKRAGKELAQYFQHLVNKYQRIPRLEYQIVFQIVLFLCYLKLPGKIFVFLCLARTAPSRLVHGREPVWIIRAGAGGGGPGRLVCGRS